MEGQFQLRVTVDDCIKTSQETIGALWNSRNMASFNSTSIPHRFHGLHVYHRFFLLGSLLWSGWVSSAPFPWVLLKLSLQILPQVGYTSVQYESSVTVGAPVTSFLNYQWIQLLEFLSQHHYESALSRHFTVITSKKIVFAVDSIQT